MGQLRRFLLSALPKTALSRLTGWLTRIPLPRGLRAPLYGWFSRRYSVVLTEVDRDLVEFRSLAEFFGRPLRKGARPVAAPATLVWPCDGKIVSAGPMPLGRILQVKGMEYELAELVANAELAGALADGTQATIYLAPGDYHRVHAPFAGTLGTPVRVPGALFPVNPPAVQSIPRLFARNERVVFPFTLEDGRVAALVMVAALNVGDIVPSAAAGQQLPAGAELGRFGFGSTVVALMQSGSAGFPLLAPETPVRQGEAVRQGGSARPAE